MSSTYVTVKSAEDLIAGGKIQNIEFERIDTRLQGVIITTAEGTFRVMLGPYSSLEVVQPKPLAVETRFLVDGTHAGLRVHEYFETEHEAEARKSGLELISRDGDDLIITENAHQVDDAGNVMDDF